MKKMLVKLLISGALLLSANLASPIETRKFDGNPFPCPPACMPPTAR
jgi:hypothetical protein